MDLQTSIFSLGIETKLIVQCLYNQAAHTTVKSTIILSRTCHLFHTIINSEAFFNCFIYIKIPRLSSHTFKEIQSKTSFKDRYFNLRKCSDTSCQTGPGIGFGMALTQDNGIKFITVSDKDISFRLNNELLSKKIHIPETRQRNLCQECSHAAHSKDFLVFVRKFDAAIYVYTADGSTRLGIYEPDAAIIQLTIENNLLYVVEKNGGLCDMSAPCFLVIYNLNLPEQKKPLHTLSLGTVMRGRRSSPPVCIGKKHLIYWDVSSPDPRLCIHSKSYLDSCSFLISKKLASDWTARHYIFPRGDDFIQVICRNQREGAILDISTITLREKEIQIAPIAKDILLFKSVSCKELRDISYSMDRLFFAYELLSELNFYSYDMITGQLTHLLSSCELPTDLSFEPRFLAAGSNVSFLMMTRSDPAYTESDLRTWHYLI